MSTATASRPDLDLETLAAVAAERDLEAAAARALAALAQRHGPCALLVAWRCVRCGDVLAPSEGTRGALARDGRAVLAPGEGPGCLELERAEILPLAASVLLVRGAAGGDAVPGPGEELLASLIRLKDEIREQLRQIHHRINNPLCALGLNAQLLSLALAGDARLAERARQLERDAARIQELLRELREPFRKPAPRR